MPKAKASKKKQARLPGTEQPSIPEIDEAAGALIAANSERGAASQRVKQAQEQLLKALKANDKEHYKVDGIEAWVDHGSEKAKAKEVEQPAERRITFFLLIYESIWHSPFRRGALDSFWKGNVMRKYLSKAILALTICFNVSIGWVASSTALPAVATVAVVATLTQTACSPDELAASAADVLSVLTDPTLIKALQTLSPPLLKKIEALVPIAKDLITAIKNGDVSTALAAVNTIFPVIEEAFALFSGGNPAVLAVLALANIALHFIINHVKNTKTAKAARMNGIAAVQAADDFGSKPVWGCSLRQDKRCTALAH